MFLLTIIPDISSSERLKKLQEGSISEKHAEVEKLDKELLAKQARKKGDINDDGKIDHEDIEILKDYLGGKSELTEEQRKNSDLNQDGVVDERDFKILYSFATRREVEDKVRDLQDLYSSLSGQHIPGHVVLNVDNENIESVKSELDSAKALLVILNKRF